MCTLAWHVREQVQREGFSAETGTFRVALDEQGPTARGPQGPVQQLHFSCLGYLYIRTGLHASANRGDRSVYPNLKSGLGVRRPAG